MKRHIKIYIHYQTVDQPWGGINSFLRSLKEYFRTLSDVKVLYKPSHKMDIFLISAASKSPNNYVDASEIHTLLKKRDRLFFKLFRKKFIIVHRLDGLRATYAGKFIPNDQSQIEISKLADFIIFQSKSSLESFRKFGFKGENYTIINNGVDQNIYNTNDKKYFNKIKDSKIKILAVSWSNNINKGFKIVSELSLLDKVEMIFVGRWNNTVPINNVKLIPPQNSKLLSSHYKKSHVFLHAAINDPCPNVVLEALSCGLPVLYHNSGGTKELAKDFGISLPTQITQDSLKEIILKMINNYDMLVDNIIKSKKKFSIDSIGDKYLETFKKLIDNK